MSEVPQPQSHKKTIFWVLASTFLFAFMVVYFGIIRPARATSDLAINGVYLTAPTTINDFTLKDNHSNVFTQDNLKGHWTMLFFGFTNCGMVCPTTMSALNGMYKSLQQKLPDNQLPQVVFISVDPDRDSISRINDYVSAFNPHFIGARADIHDTIALEKQLHIVAAKLQADGGGKDNYTINHSAEILLVNPEGKLQAYLSYPHTSDSLVKDYRTILSKA